MQKDHYHLEPFPEYVDPNIAFMWFQTHGHAFMCYCNASTHLQRLFTKFWNMAEGFCFYSPMVGQVRFLVVVFFFFSGLSCDHWFCEVLFRFEISLHLRPHSATANASSGPAASIMAGSRPSNQHRVGIGVTATPLASEVCIQRKGLSS